MICDRGTMDVAAFLTPEMWRALLDEHQAREIDLRGGRYDAVIHVTTAALGAEEFYSLDNNPARTETPEQAREADARILKAWTGHPHLRVIGNDSDFDTKVQAIVTAVCGVVGVPEPMEIERWFRVGNVHPELPVHSVTVPIEQTYLLDPDPDLEVRVRRRGEEGSVYTYCTKRRVGPGKAIEKERRIKAREYIEALALRDPGRKTVKKQRTCFLWEGQYFELDRFDNGMVRLEVEVESLETEILFPPFIEILEEVTGQEAYSNYALSLIKE
jgi:CYTH domain-containing protein